MTNIIDYIKWRGDLNFDQSKINKLDCLLFSQIIMHEFNEIVPTIKENKSIKISDAINQYDSSIGKDHKLGLIIPNAITKAFYLMGESNRYKDLELSDYINDIDLETQSQFCALTINISKDLNVISLSATDDTLTGWIENISMLYKEELSAQQKAVKYVEEIFKKYQKNIIICGHSKGGHLSIYATLMINDQAYNMVKATYSFDGQGIINLEERYDKKRLKKITTYLPQGSVVGRLFDHPEKQLIVHSNLNSLFQHDIFSWEIIGNDFVYEKKFDKDGEDIKKIMTQTIEEMDYEHRLKFVQVLEEISTSTGAKTLTDLSSNKKSVISSYFKIDKKERKYLSEPIKKIIRNKGMQKCIIKTIKDLKKYNI